MAKLGFKGPTVQTMVKLVQDWISQVEPARETTLLTQEFVGSNPDPVMVITWPPREPDTLLETDEMEGYIVDMKMSSPLARQALKGMTVSPYPLVGSWILMETLYRPATMSGVVQLAKNGDPGFVVIG